MEECGVEAPTAYRGRMRRALTQNRKMRGGGVQIERPVLGEAAIRPHAAQTVEFNQAQLGPWIERQALCRRSEIDHGQASGGNGNA